MFHSPPHRWLRKSIVPAKTSVHDSPPHRWLRNPTINSLILHNNSPPHRWLRKNGDEGLFCY
ncbi:hypothetical protein [uncultured Gammaproteobacteria bacterium]|nr:hypothetical protein [uncultured Gammaproteobacteria bacterium]